jgi:uracil-DNA glycosylase
MSTAAKFVGALRELSFDNAFNPYSDLCAVYDRASAPTKRCAALYGILSAAAAGGVHSVWIGRDLGYRGGRRTGLALTDDAHVQVHAARWGIRTAPFTKGRLIKERTATLVWKVLDAIDLPIFLWNIFPLHPHEPDRPFTNRTHCVSERAVGEDLLSELLSLLHPERVVALGGDAARSVERIAPTATVRVRHPSYGGQPEFLKQTADIYGDLRSRDSPVKHLFGSAPGPSFASDHDVYEPGPG